jgi:hypothetical protein
MSKLCGRLTKTNKPCTRKINLQHSSCYLHTNLAFTESFTYAIDISVINGDEHRHICTCNLRNDKINKIAKIIENNTITFIHKYPKAFANDQYHIVLDKCASHVTVGMNFVRTLNNKERLEAKERLFLHLPSESLGNTKINNKTYRLKLNLIP